MSLKDLLGMFDPSKKANESSNLNVSLSQGVNFNNMQAKIDASVEPQLSLIEQTTSPGLGSIIENFSGNTPEAPLNKVNTKEYKELQALEDDFNKALTAYTAKQNSVMSGAQQATRGKGWNWNDIKDNIMWQGERSPEDCKAACNADSNCTGWETCNNGKSGPGCQGCYMINKPNLSPPINNGDPTYQSALANRELQGTVKAQMDAMYNALQAKAKVLQAKTMAFHAQHQSLAGKDGALTKQKVNKRVLESLVMSGTLDVLEGNRSQKYASIDEAIQYGQQMQAEKNVNQVDMFGNLSEKDNLIKVPLLMDLENWDEKESLDKEKEVLGFYISGHPLLKYSEDLEEFTSFSFDEKDEISKKDLIIIGGMITRVVKKFDRRNREMGFFDLECLGGTIEVIAFSDCFNSFSNLIESESVVFIRGRAAESTYASEIKIICDEIIPVKDIRKRLSQRLNINFFNFNKSIGTKELEKLMDLAKNYLGDCKMIFHLPNGDSKRPVKVVAHNIKVSTESNFIKKLRVLYGKERVWVD